MELSQQTAELESMVVGMTLEEVQVLFVDSATIENSVQVDQFGYKSIHLVEVVQ